MSTRTTGDANFLDDRLGVSRITKPLSRRVFPDHWSFLQTISKAFAAAMSLALLQAASVQASSVPR